MTVVEIAPQEPAT